ncbi:MAG TPA: glycoside hydrolase family 3 C-terminal domain-containing protein [Steroidobacteraceae bacterium]
MSEYTRTAHGAGDTRTGALWRVVAAGAALALGACHPRASEGGGTGVDALLQRMSLADKISLLHGASDPARTDRGEAGYLPGIPRLGIAPLRFADGPPGALTRYPATGLTATMGLAASFSRQDASDNGSVIARDAKAAGVDVVLEPFINIHRDPAFYRAYNTFGEDPLLSGEIGAAQIRGIQDGGVMAEAKHYIAYNGAAEVSVDAQTLHEIYLAPFAAAVGAHVACIMCSYNAINGSYACGNSVTLTSILRGQLHFDGFVTSDWGAAHATTFINEGMDVEMPGSVPLMDSYFAGTRAGKAPSHVTPTPPVINHIPEETAPEPVAVPRLPSAPPIGLLAALRDGSVKEGTITQAVRRVLTQMQRFGHLGQFSSPAAPSGIESPQTVEANAAVVRRTALDAAVLLKNDGALPLRSADLRSLAMIGPGALQDMAVGESGEKALGRVERQIGTSAALQQAAGVRVVEAVADDMTGTPIPAAQLAHSGGGGAAGASASAGAGAGAGLQRRDGKGRAIGIDATLDFTRQRGNALPSGSELEWTGVLQVPQGGRYRLYLQILGAKGSLSLDGQTLATTSDLGLHGNILQPGQDNVLPTSDGLDNVRRELELGRGPHAIQVRVHGEAYGQPVQVRLAWVTPQQRAADYDRAVQAARSAHTAIVFAWGRGRPVFHLPGDQDQLISDVAAANPNTVVVLNVSEPIAMPWLDRVKAVLLMWYPGDEGGRAGADLLLGRASPAGRLPFTWPRALESGPANDPAHPERTSRGLDGKTTYSEGIFVGYRWFDRQGIEPQFPFGYGLTYTRFEYSDLQVRRAADGGLDASFELRNTGTVDSDEVPQLYLSAPTPAPADAQFANRALAAFDRVHLAAGTARRITLHAGPRALQYWSNALGQWQTATGSRVVYVGASSRDLRLQAQASVTAD